MLGRKGLGPQNTSFVGRFMQYTMLCPYCVTSSHVLCREVYVCTTVHTFEGPLYSKHSIVIATNIHGIAIATNMHNMIIATDMHSMIAATDMHRIIIATDTHKRNRV